MSPLAFDIALAAVGGLCLGSFLNVVAYRLPAGMSLVTPAVGVPRLRRRDPALRQRAGGLVAAPGRALPRV